MAKLAFIIYCLMPLPVVAQLTMQSMDGPRGRIGFFRFLPKEYAAKGQAKHPLIIFLHGIGEKGTGAPQDLARVNCCGLPKYIAAGHDMQFTWQGKTESFVVLYPQLYSRYGTWENYYVDAMLEYAKANLQIDTNRIFLTGLSLGGGGTWVYASASFANASKFAGIVPVVSPCFMTNGCNIANAALPVLAIHAADDIMASPDCTTGAIRSILRCGTAAEPNLIMYPNGSHFVWVRRAFDTEYNYNNPNIYEWMLAQNRTLPPNKKPVADAGKDLTIAADGAPFVLDAEKSSDPDGRVVRFVWQKVSGPSFGILSREVTARPEVRGLTHPGVYTFSVKVVDDRAEWSTDLVRVTVVDGGVIND